MKRTCVLLVVLGALFGPSVEASAQDWPELATAPELGGGEKDAALIVGIEDYVFAPDIAGAAQNATDWYSFLTKGRGISPTRVILLRNEEATREAIQKHAKAVAKKVDKGGTLWVVFIGHGAPAADGRGGVLVGVDAQQSADGLYARSLGQLELEKLISGGKQGHTVMMLDACFSGKTSTGAPIAPGLQPLIPVKDVSARATVLTAGASDQFAGPLPGLDRPAFSYLMLGALRGWADGNADGQVTVDEAIGYAQSTLQVVVKDRTQRPEVSGADMGFVLASNARESGPDLTEIVAGRKASASPPRNTEVPTGMVSRPADPNPAGGNEVPFSINAGLGTLAQIVAQVPLSDTWALTPGFGGWLLDFDGLDERSTFSLSASLGARWLWSGSRDSGFLGFGLAYFFSKAERCDMLTGDTCTAVDSFQVFALTTHVGKRWTIGEHWNVTARAGGGLVGSPSLGQLFPDLELSGGYDF